MTLDYSQVIAQATTGWTRSCDPGTSCSIIINGTTRSGANASVYLVDLMVSTRDTLPVDLKVYDGTTGTVYLFRAEFPGTSLNFTKKFGIYPRTTWGTMMHIYAESMGQGTVSLAAGGFNI